MIGKVLIVVMQLLISALMLMAGVFTILEYNHRWIWGITFIVIGVLIYPQGRDKS